MQSYAHVLIAQFNACAANLPTCALTRIIRPSRIIRNMAKKAKVKTISSLLDDLDKPLYGGKWREIEQTLKKTSKKLIIPESFLSYLEGKEHLENSFLGATPANLDTARQKLKQCLNLCQPGHDAALSQLARIGYGQTFWLRNDPLHALPCLQEGVQATVDTSLLHTCKVLAEGNMFLGLCLEQLGGIEGDTDLSQALGAYEEATRLSLNFLHLAKSSGLSHHPVAYKAIKVATERGPVLAFHLGEPARALSLFRRVLQARDEDTLQESRFICATSLASLLAFHTSPDAHLLPKPSSLLISAPSHLHEEAILVTNIAKAYIDVWEVSKTNPVPSPEVIFDLLCLSLTCVSFHEQFVQALEVSMKFAFMVPHVWFQFGLSLVASGKDSQAMAVFKECISLSPCDPVILCTAAKFALEKSTKPELCIEWASSVHENHFLQPRAQFLLGRGYSVLSERELSSESRAALFKKSLERFKRAADLDPKNIDYAFYLALQYAESRELQKGREQIQHALSLNAGHTSCLHLLGLIYSAEKLYTEALQICDFALGKQPENFGILECKIKLEVITTGTNQAFKTCRHALKQWQKVFSEESTGMMGAIMQDGVSLSDLHLTGFQRDDPFNIGRSVTPDFASDAGSSHFSINTTTQTTPNQPNLLQARIWCTIAEVFLLANKTADAVSCIREAQYLAPYLPTVFISYGRILAIEKKYDQALEQFRSALVLQPVNPTALTQVGRILHLSGRSVEAEKYLREVTSIDRLHHEAWYWLGQVICQQKLHELGSDCFKMALELEKTTPVQPFSAVLSSFLPSS